MRHEVIASRSKSIPSKILSNYIYPFWRIHSCLYKPGITYIRTCKIGLQSLRAVICIRHTRLKKMRHTILLADLLTVIVITGIEIRWSLQGLFAEGWQYPDKILRSEYSCKPVYIWREFCLRVSPCELCRKHKLWHISVQLLSYIQPFLVRLWELSFRTVKKYLPHTSQSFTLRISPLIASGLHLPVALRYKTHHVRYTFEAPIQGIPLKCHLVHIIPGYNATTVCGNIVQETRNRHDTSCVYPVIWISIIYNVWRYIKVMTLCKGIVVWEQMPEILFILPCLVRILFYVQYIAVTIDCKPPCYYHDLLICEHTSVIYLWIITRYTAATFIPAKCIYELITSSQQIVCRSFI